MAYTTISDAPAKAITKNKKSHTNTKNKSLRPRKRWLFLVRRHPYNWPWCTIRTMETKPIEDLKEDPTNPRIISNHDGLALAASMKEFGDLSCIVFNVQTGQLVGGHQRINLLKPMLGDKKVWITQRFEQPDRVGTIALGYVTHNGVQYAYREVDWPKSKQQAANIAANRIQGEFKLDMLAQVNYEISQAEDGSKLLELTGQTEKEIDKLMKSVGVGDDDMDQTPPEDKQDKFEFAVTRDQRELIERALAHVKGTRDLQALQAASQNGAAMFVICQDWLNAQPELPSGELTDIPS